MEKNKSTYNLLIGILALAAIILVILVVGYVVAQDNGPRYIQGEAEATEYRVSGKVPGRIAEFRVREGEFVHKGDTLVVIDSPEIRSKIAEANAAKAAADAQRKKAMNGARTEQITGAYELWQQAIVQEEVLRKSFERVQSLFDQKVISEQKYDETKAKYDAACAQTKAAKSQYDMAVAGAREEDKEAAIALVDRANAAVELVNSYLEELYLTAPADGIISDVFPKVGELVGTGSPIMTVQDLADMWLTFNIREDQLHSLRIGDQITLQVPALDGCEIAANVYYLKARESYATWKATKEIGEYDTKTFEVRARPNEAVEGLLPGMSVLIKK